VTNLQRRFHALLYTLRGPRPQDAGSPWLLSVLTSESDSRPGKCLHQQSNLPLCLNRPWLLQFFLSNYIVKLQCLQRAPDAGLQKRATFSTIIVVLAGTGNQTRATCKAGSGTNRSAIHYNFEIVFQTAECCLELGSVPKPSLLEHLLGKLLEQIGQDLLLGLAHVVHVAGVCL
jgi:hypothetical protein